MKLTKMKDYAKAMEASMKEAQKEAKKAGLTMIKEGLAEFFEAFPDVLGLRWTQYTPYFNDGEACEFRVHDAEVRVKGREEEEGDSGEEGWLSGYDLKDQKDDLKASLDAFSNVITSGGMNTTMLATFGDHVEVTVGRDGKATVEDYEHE